jgi:uncharacterized protein
MIETRRKVGTTVTEGIFIGIVVGIVLTVVSLNYLQTNTNFLAKIPFLATTSTSTSTVKASPEILTKEALTGNEVRMIIPAVDESGNGVTTLLSVQAKPGSGKVLIDVNNLFFFVDTQNSIRTAREVAQNVSGIDLSKVDLIYSVDANVSAVEGPSAGAALTIATIAAVENKTPNPHVVISGTINPDGTIGPIGGVLEKAKAAKEAGATSFLVPDGQGTSTTYQPQQNCKTIGPITYCTNEYKGSKTDISSAAGITIKEVSTINDALSYFII